MSTGRKWIRRGVSWFGKGLGLLIIAEPAIQAGKASGGDPAVFVDGARYRYTGVRSDGSLDQGQLFRAITTVLAGVGVAVGLSYVARRF